tara:strand:- start:378 stop:2669 length:2292 start_codon:yes stop_codon:yes gene_type:complete
MKQTIKLFIFSFSFFLIITILAYLSLLNSKVTNKLEGALWTIPAKVYSRPLELAEGTNIQIRLILKELELLSYEEVSVVQKPGQYVLKDNILSIFIRGVEKENSDYFHITLKKGRIASIKRSDGISIDLIRLEPLAIGGMYPSHMEDRILLKWTEVPEELIEMILLVEDRTFFDHQGVCYKCIVRALIKNIRAEGIEEGGSTITQQLAKSWFFTPEQTLRRKIKEALAAFFIEFHYTKEEILLAYINDVFIAQSGGRAIHGIGLAAQYFFSSSIENLSTDQMALIVGMLKGPSQYHPTRNSKRAKDRRDLVLNLLFNSSIINQEELNDLIERPLKVIKPTYKSQSKYPYFSDLVTIDLKKNFKDRDLRTKGLKIITNLDPVIQSLLENSLEKTKKQLEKKYGSTINDLQGAALVIDSLSGEIISAVGSVNPQSFGFNRAINAIRPIGSLVKPFIYLTALKNHHDYNLSTLIDDSKLTVRLSEGKNWEPNNFDKKYHGFVPLHKALWDSYNIASARLGIELGYASIQETLKSLGIENDLPNYPSAFVGAFEMTPLQAIQAYQTIASGGFHSPLRSVREVKSSDRELSLTFPYRVEQRFRPETIFILKFILKQTFERGTARGYAKKRIEKWGAGGKTGTSDEQRDSWFVGYAGDYLVLVWLGFDDNRKSPLTGRSGALEVWKRLINQLDPLASEIRKPSRIKYEWVDLNDGLLSGELCKNSFLAPFIIGTEPKIIPEERKKCRVNKDSYPSKIFKKIKRTLDIKG